MVSTQKLRVKQCFSVIVLIVTHILLRTREMAKNYQFPFPVFSGKGLGDG